jgi:hypothetical protein
MPEDLSFHFPIPTLLRDGDAITTAAEAHAELNPRLPAGLLAATRALLGAVSSGDAAAKGRKGGVGALTQEQNARLAQLTKWISRARQTASLAFKAQTVKLREEFQVGVNEPNDLASILQRGRVVVASVKQTANLAALKAKGWLDADTTAFEGAITALASTDSTQETGKGEAKDATGARNRDANLLYDNLLTIQNAADLHWPEDVPANAGVRDEFRLQTFPPRGGNDKKPEPPKPPTPPPA